MKLNKYLNDQPGRILAVFVFAPIIYKKSLKYKDKFLKLFSLSLFCWDLFWLISYKPQKLLTNFRYLKNVKK